MFDFEVVIDPRSLTSVDQWKTYADDTSCQTLHLSKKIKVLRPPVEIAPHSRLSPFTRSTDLAPLCQNPTPFLSQIVNPINHSDKPAVVIVRIIRVAFSTPVSRAQARGAVADGINSQALSIIHASDRRAGLRNVTLPSLVIHGIQDTLIPVDLGAEIAAQISDSEYHAIEGMGHVITPLLAPVIVEIVTEFIGRRT